MMKFIDAALGVRRVTVKENQRALALYKGRIKTILGPGEHVLRDRGRLEIEMHDLVRPEFVSAYAPALFRDHPILAQRHLTDVRTGADEVALVTRDGRLHAVLKPDERMTYWTDVGPFTVERIVIADDLAVPENVRKRLVGARKFDGGVGVDVPEGQVGLLFADGALPRRLEPGAHQLRALSRK